LTTVDFQPENFLILYPALENSTTGIAINENNKHLDKIFMFSDHFFVNLKGKKPPDFRTKIG
jgi:hypothetical protein